MNATSSTTAIPIHFTPGERRFAGLVFLLVVAGIGLWLADWPVYGGGLLVTAAFFGLSLMDLRWGWACVVAAAPFSVELPTGIGGAAIQFPTEILLLLVLAFWWFQISGRGLRLPARQPLDLPVALLIGAGLFSLLGSTHPDVTLKACAVLTWYVLVGYAFPTHHLRTPRDVAWTTGLIAAATVAVALVGIADYAEPGVAVGAPLRAGGYAAPFFTEHGTYAAYISFTLGLTLSYALGRGTGHARWIYRAVSALLLVAVLLSGTRAAWVGLPFLLLVLYAGQLMFRPGLGKLLVLLVLLPLGAAALVMMLVTPSLERQFASIFNVTTSISNIERFNRWLAALAMWRDSPVFGQGLGTYVQNYALFRDFSSTTPVSHLRMGVHSEYLAALAEMGMVGLAAMLTVMGGIVWVGFRAARHARDLLLRETALGAVAGFVSYMVHGLFNNYLTYDKIAVPFWLSAGLVGAVWRQSRARESDAPAGH